MIMDAFHGSLFELRLTLSCPRHESGAWNDHRAFAVEIVSFLSLGMRSSTVPSRVFQPGHVTVVLGEAQRALPAMGCAGQHCTSSSISRPAAKMHPAQDIGVRGLLHGRAQVHPRIGHSSSSASRLAVANPTLSRRPINGHRHQPACHSALNGAPLG
ncbi:MAG: hypothetical protein IOC63_04180 [Methylobacterium sp.]|nr:hypothetical protein [Methylobacterium sp.]